MRVYAGTGSRTTVNDAVDVIQMSGGAGGKGNPQGSQCLGYKHYVELVEPAANRACIKCCDDAADCPTNKGARSMGRYLRGCMRLTSL